MSKRTLRNKEENTSLEPSYLTYKLKTSLAYYISSLKNKNMFLDSFIKNNTHSKQSEAEFIQRTKSDIWYLERHLLIANTFTQCEQEKLPEWMRCNLTHQFFSSDIIKGYKDNDWTMEELLYLDNWEVPLDDTIASMLIGYGNLKPLILKELEKGNTEITVFI